MTRAGDLVVLEGAGEGGAAYVAANERILDKALHLAGIAAAVGLQAMSPIPPDIALAVIIWEGRSRGEDDITERFATSARGRSLEVYEIL